MTECKAEAEAIHEITREAYAPAVLTIADPLSGVSVPVLLAPKGMVAIAVPFEANRERPVRREGRAVATTLKSFQQLVARYEDENSGIFAQRDDAGTNLSLLGVIDWHEGGTEGKARFGKHTVLYKFPLSEEWKAWNAASGQEMNQAVFAAFIEERIADVGDAGGASERTKDLIAQLGVSLASPPRLLELSRGLSVHVSSKVAGSQNLSTGERVISFSEDHQDPKGEPLRIPGAFLISIPVFRDDAAYALPVRLTYRVQNGAVLWKVTLYRADRALDDAFKRAVEDVGKGVKASIFYGSPE